MIWKRRIEVGIIVEIFKNGDEEEKISTGKFE